MPTLCSHRPTKPLQAQPPLVGMTQHKRSDDIYGNLHILVLSNCFVYKNESSRHNEDIIQEFEMQTVPPHKRWVYSTSPSAKNSRSICSNQASHFSLKLRLLSEPS